MKIYLEGPVDLTSFAITVIRNGETTKGVDIDLKTIEAGYKTSTFAAFAEAYLKPAFAQLFPE